MLYRCSSPKSPNYESYGGRGIQVCEQWTKSVQAFIEWAEANGYQDNLTIDRIDVDGNYEPSNCKWSTIQEQNFNKRNTRWVEVDGSSYTLQELAETYGLPYEAIAARYKRGARGNKLIAPIDQSKVRRRSEW
jgi:hypothetical protein